MKYKSKFLTTILIIFVSLVTTVSAKNKSPDNQQTQLDKTVNNLANKLFTSSKINYSNEQNIAITSFVNLNKFNSTNHLGRALSESFFDELFTRGFNISDFRGQNTISVNANGEYFLTRDVKLLKENISNNYVLVGTYTTIENSILINARIMDNATGTIVASAKSYYNTTDCNILNNCKQHRRINIVSHDNYFIKEAIKTPKYTNIRQTSMPIAYNKKSARTIIKNQTNEISLIN